MSLPHGEISCECQKDPEEIYSFFFNYAESRNTTYHW